jgi:hypothetical protein
MDFSSLLGKLKNFVDQEDEPLEPSEEKPTDQAIEQLRFKNLSKEMKEVDPKDNYYSEYGSHPQDTFLKNIEQLESSSGDNQEHPEIKYGIHKGTKAIGKFGLMPLTLQDISKNLKNKKSMLKMAVGDRLHDPELEAIADMDPKEIEAYIKSNPNLEIRAARYLASKLDMMDGDELDKAFAGGTGSADSDGGTSSRIFGSFLTWMQEKTSPVFVMATANRIERLPGEFLRKGRFDEIFFVDLPNSEERQDIFNIHLTKRRSDISRFDLEQLAKVSDGFSGAEIEQALIAAMYEAFAQDREFTQLDIIAAIKATLPLSRTMTEQVTALRDWARQRARPASASVAEYQRLEF